MDYKAIYRLNYITLSVNFEGCYILSSIILNCIQKNVNEFNMIHADSAHFFKF